MGIRFKLILPLLVTYISFILLIFFQWAPVQVERSRNEFLNHQSNLLRAMESDIIRHVLAKDYAALYASMDEQLERQKIFWQELTLELKGGKRLYHRDIQRFGTRALSFDNQASCEACRQDHCQHNAGGRLVREKAGFYGKCL